MRLSSSIKCILFRKGLTPEALRRPLLVASPRRKHMDQSETTPNSPRRNEDIALDLLKFVAASTAGSWERGLRPPPASSPASSNKPEEQVNHLLALYTKCLAAVQGK